MTLIRIVAPHFVAGLEASDRVVRAAPILRYMIHWERVERPIFIQGRT